MVCADQTCWDAPTGCRGDVKLGRSPGRNLLRAERSRLCIYAFVEKRSTNQEINQWINPINTCEASKIFRSISRVVKFHEYAQSLAMMELDLAPGESREYWKYHAPGGWFKQAKAVGKFNNEKATMFFDSGAEFSIVYTTFALKV